MRAAAASSSNTSSRPHSNQRRPNPSQQHDGFREWTFLVPIKPDAPALGSLLAKFFQSAKELVGKDSETMQAVISRLATEGGLLRINEVAQRIQNANSAQQRSAIFDKELDFLLRILSNRDVSSSLVLETHVETILTFLYGAGGRRARAVFTFAAAQLRQNLDKNTDDFTESLDACCVVLAKILDLQSSATLSTDFNDIYDVLRLILDDMVEGNTASWIGYASKTIDHIGRRLGIRSTVDIESASTHTAHTQPTFQLTQVSPAGLWALFYLRPVISSLSCSLIHS